MALKLYFDLMSQPSRAVYIFLKLNKVPFIECPVALRKGEHLGEEYAKVNPFKKVPAIDHDGFKLSESVAILRYLVKKVSPPDHWYPKDIQSRAKVDEYLEWQHLNTRASAALYFREKLIIPMMTGKPVDEAKVGKLAKQLEVTLNEIENIILPPGKLFIGGQEQISIADLLCACELEQPTTVGFDIYKGRPRLQQYMNRVRDATNPIYDEAHSFIYKLKASNAKL